MSGLRPIRSWLYAPGNNSRLLDKVFTAGADAVILDLEDAVPPAEKLRARAMVAEAVRARAGKAGPFVCVRVNHPDSGLTRDDIAAVVGPGLDGLRFPKIESAAALQACEAWVGDAEVLFTCNVETARGVWSAHEIASSSPRVHALVFGEVDFMRDVQGSVGPQALETLHARSHLVLASRVAGIGPPIDGVYMRLDDDEGLERTTRQSRGLGFFGRSALHPRQVPIINAVFTPTSEDIARAQQIVQAAQAAEREGRGAIRMPGGDFVDVPVVRRAEATLRLAETLNR